MEEKKITNIAVHSRHIDDVVSELQTHVRLGLSPEEAASRLATHGPNELVEVPGPTLLHRLIQQLRDFLVLILIAAAIIAIFIGEFVDAAAIIAIVVINAVIGVIQESKAENALRALKRMAAPTAQVIRDGHALTVPAREVVPGDIVLLEAGNYVPADMRLVESVNLKVNEASLTGESLPVEKHAGAVLDQEIPVGDRVNTAFMSTVVTYGRGKGIVTTTGMTTQIGLIAKMLQAYEEEPTPLQRKLEGLGKTLGTITLAVCAFIFLVGVLRDTQVSLIVQTSGGLLAGLLAYLQAFKAEIVELFMTAVSLAIAAVPEGLPAVVTICLALGMQRMVRRHALLRKLPAVETLGAATAICSDKTGTLTQNEMTVVKLYADQDVITVAGRGYQPVGGFSRDGQPFDPRRDPAASLLLQGALLCNDARLEESASNNGGGKTYRMVGDPTEGALVVVAAKAGLRCLEQEEAFPRVGEIPFDSDRKRMTTINQVVDGHSPDGVFHTWPALTPTPYLVFTKGAPDVLLEVCDRIVQGGQIQSLQAEQRQALLQANTSLAAQALRVLAVAYRPLDSLPEKPLSQEIERNLIFVGLLGMIDPARPEVKDAVDLCRQAGIKAVMITGDYPETARAIAKELDLFTPGRETLTGQELEQLSDEEFAALVNEVDVYARTSPKHKVRIVEALKSRGHIVAMTGDGVNDAPALKRADIGVAMGITGTDVAKETADMVLTDDNFASIVSAVEEGRVIYSNIRKFVFYLLSCNIGEILILFLGMILLGLRVLRPIQLLWLNLLTDGLPALALGVEKGDPDIMQRPPRPANEPIINRTMRWGILTQSIAVTVATLGAFVFGLWRFADSPPDYRLTAAQTTAFVVLNCAELLVAYAFRSERYPLHRIGVFSNRFMVLATASSFLLLLAVVYVPFLDPIFHTVELDLVEWLVMIPLMLIPVVTAELTKFFLRRRERGG
jgi:Ca2+-transporting ATPase